MQTDTNNPSFWKGPLVDGVTQSLLNFWICDPFSAYLKLILGLEESTPPNQNLLWGDAYHVGLEHYLRDKDCNAASEAAVAHLSPYALPSFKYSIPKMLRCYSLKGHMDAEWETEQQIDQEVHIPSQSSPAIHKFRIRGKVDGQCFDHPDYERILAEHKCKGYIDPPTLAEEIYQDLQVNIYMHLLETEYVAYDLIKIPDTQKYGPTQRHDESPQDWVERIYHDGSMGSYNNTFPIFRYRNKWVHQQVYFLPEEGQALYWEQTIKPLLLRLQEWYEFVTDPSFSMDDPQCYGPLFYKMPIRHFDARKTESFKCPYHSYLTGSTELDDLVPIPSLYQELEP